MFVFRANSSLGWFEALAKGPLYGTPVCGQCVEIILHMYNEQWLRTAEPIATQFVPKIRKIANCMVLLEMSAFK